MPLDFFYKICYNIYIYIYIKVKKKENIYDTY